MSSYNPIKVMEENINAIENIVVHVYSDYEDRDILKSEATMTNHGYVSEDSLDSFFVVEDRTILWNEDDLWTSDLTGKRYSDDTEYLTASDGIIATNEEFQDSIHYLFSDHSNEWLHASDCFVSDDSGVVFNNDMLCSVYGGESIAETETDDYRWVEYGRAAHTYVYFEDVAYCEDIDDYVHADDAIYDDDTEEYYYDEDNIPGNKNVDLECILEWHASQRSGIDVGTKNLNTYNEPLQIGFEVEKIRFGDACSHGDYVGTYEIFSHYETDASCGVEAITHILPLGAPDSDAEKFVFKMIDDAKDIIDAEHNSNCGGHVNVSCTLPSFSDTADMYERIRGATGILYAIYRDRLRNDYSSSNKRIKMYRDQKSNEYHARCSGPVNLKEKCVEFRLPYRVRHTQQLKNRYRLMYQLLNATLIKNLNFEQTFDRCAPILEQMYEDSQISIEDIKTLSFQFHEFIVDGRIHPNIVNYI
jgi:hypothetical protein